MTTQMRFQLNRVIRRDENQDVYSLIVDQRGLYVIRTGSVGTLISGEAGNGLHKAVTVNSTQSLIDEVAENESHLHDTPLAEMVKTPGSHLVPYEAITMVRQDGNSDGIERLTIVTKEGIFAFPQARFEDVIALKHALIGR